MITSRKSPRVQQVRALHDRRGREVAGAFLAEGPGSVLAALQAASDGFGVAEQIIVTPGFLDRQPGWQVRLDEARSRGVMVTEVSDDVMAAMSPTRQPAGLLAICRRAAAPDRQRLLTPAGNDAMLVCLDRPNDPGNLGTIIRTADAAGAQGVITVGNATDPANDKAVRASAGSVFRLPVLAESEPAEFLQAARTGGWTIVATAADGEQDLYTWLANLPGPRPLLWLFGNEAHGLSGDMQGRADVIVRIPMSGPTESLNLAAAVAVCLFAPELLRVTVWDGNPRGG